MQRDKRCCSRCSGRNTVGDAEKLGSCSFCCTMDDVRDRRCPKDAWPFSMGEGGSSHYVSELWRGSKVVLV